jgi:hypothetical protein
MLRVSGTASIAKKIETLAALQRLRRGLGQAKHVCLAGGLGILQNSAMSNYVLLKNFRHGGLSDRSKRPRFFFRPYVRILAIR